MLEELDSLSIAQFHDHKLGEADWPLDASDNLAGGVWRWRPTPT